MQQQDTSFRLYWTRRKAEFSSNGISPCLDYPFLDSLANGFLLKSVEEMLPADKYPSRSIFYMNPQNNNFVTNHSLYLNELTKEVKSCVSTMVQQAREIQTEVLKKVLLPFLALKLSQESDKDSGVVSSSEVSIVTGVLEATETRLESLFHFYSFNHEIVNHLNRKIDKHMGVLGLNFRRTTYMQLLNDPNGNVFSCGLMLDACIKTFVLITENMLENIRVESAEHSRINEVFTKLNKYLLSIENTRKMIFSQLIPGVQKVAISRVESKREEIIKESLDEFNQAKDKMIVAEPSALKIGQINITYSNKKLNDDNYHLDSERQGLDKEGVQTENIKPREFNKNMHQNLIPVDVSHFYANISQDKTEKTSASYNRSDVWFVLVHTFLFMLTYYGLTPTNPDYNTYLGVPKSLFGLVSAITPLFAGISCFSYNYFTKSGYKTSYYVSLFCLISGTFVYSLAFTVRSAILLLIGRALLGYGSGRILTRKFVSLEITLEYRVLYSALLVGITSLAMTFGPGLSALLEIILDPAAAKGYKFDKWQSLSEESKVAAIDNLTSFKVLGMRFSKLNYLASFVMCLYIIFLIVFVIFFDDIPKKNSSDKKLGSEKNPGQDKIENHVRDWDELSELGEVRILPEDTKSAGYSIDARSEKVSKGKRLLASLEKHFTDKQTYYVGLFFFLIKAIQECIVVEGPAYVVKNYKYTSTISGLIFFCFTVFTLPSSLTPSMLKNKFTERQILLWSSLLLVCALLVKVQFTKELYPFWLFIAASCAVLSLTLVVETCCSSIISKVISEKRMKSFFNAGLIAGLLDTFGRALGSISITIFNTFIDISQLNCILYPFWLGALVLTMIGLIYMYQKLDIKTYFIFK